MSMRRQEAENRGQFSVSCFANRNFESSFANRSGSCRIYQTNSKLLEAERLERIGLCARRQNRGLWVKLFLFTLPMPSDRR